MNLKARLSIAFGAAVLSSTASAQTIYVDAALATGAGDGTSWANAFQGELGLQDALTGAVQGQDIYVASGTYKPGAAGARTVSFRLKTGVAIYGGFVGGELSPAQRPAFGSAPTVLSADLLGDDTPTGNRSDNSFHVLNGLSAQASALLDGFEVSGGNANGSGQNDKGGGILVFGSGSPTIQNCLFRDNRCTFGGGAGYLNGSSPKFYGVTFEDNLGGAFGGAFDIATGGAIVFDGCTFRGNRASRAGALEIFATGAVRVVNCLFVDNVATGSSGGGGLWLGNGGQSLISNCTIVGNRATVSVGGGIRVQGSAPVLRNLILWDNEGPGGAQGLNNQVSGATNLRYSLVEGGAAGTNGIVNADPMFTDAAGGDYTLMGGSPAIDAGDNAGVPSGFANDFLGRRRFIDDPMTADTGLGGPPVVDMGPFEFPAGIIGSAYCETGINNTGQRARIDAYGSTVAADNDVTLVATALTPNQFGIFLASRQEGFTANPGASSGNLCLGGQIGRLVAAGQIVNSGSGGTYSLVLDLTSIPTPTGFVAVAAGESWSFQSWYRDLTFIGATSNYTDGTTIAFD